MRLRFPCLTHAAYAQPNATEAESVIAPPAEQPVRAANSVELTGARARRWPVATYFSPDTQLNAASPSTSATVKLPKLSRTQLDAAIDQWAQTQAGNCQGLTSLAAHIKKFIASEQCKKIFTKQFGPVRLFLGGSNLTSVPAEIAYAKTLEALHLHSNKLSSIPAELSQLKTLNRLELSDNQFTSFPVEMSQLSALKHLNLNRNKLTSFPAEMSQAHALETLLLDNNALTSFPRKMAQAKSLNCITLNHNQMTSFPAEMGDVHTLKILDLSHNRLTNLPPEIAQLPNLERLNLRNNRFTQVPRALLDLPPVEDQELPIENAELPVVREIDLRDNPIIEEEILAVRALMQARREAGQPLPNLILPGIAADADNLGIAAINGMNVHETVLTNAFEKRLDEVAKQFPTQLQGTVDVQSA